MLLNEFQLQLKLDALKIHATGVTKVHWRINVIERLRQQIGEANNPSRLAGLFGDTNVASTRSHWLRTQWLDVT